jgi:hypothetical protein
VQVATRLFANDYKQLALTEEHSASASASKVKNRQCKCPVQVGKRGETKQMIDTTFEQQMKNAAQEQYRLRRARKNKAKIARLSSVAKKLWTEGPPMGFVECCDAIADLEEALRDARLEQECAYANGY